MVLDFLTVFWCGYEITILGKKMGIKHKRQNSALILAASWLPFKVPVFLNSPFISMDMAPCFSGSLRFFPV